MIRILRILYMDIVYIAFNIDVCSLCCISYILYIYYIYCMICTKKCCMEYVYTFVMLIWIYSDILYSIFWYSVLHMLIFWYSVQHILIFCIAYADILIFCIATKRHIVLSIPLCGAAADQQKYFFPPSSNSFVVVQNTICILAPPVKNLWYFPYFLISLLTQFLFSLQARVLNFWPLSLKELVTNFVLSPILIFCPVLIPGRWQIWGKWGQLFTGAAFGKRQQAQALFSRNEQSQKLGGTCSKFGLNRIFVTLWENQTGAQKAKISGIRTCKKESNPI